MSKSNWRRFQQIWGTVHSKRETRRRSAVSPAPAEVFETRVLLSATASQVTQLAFSSQPTDTTAGQTIAGTSGSVAVKVSDSSGNPLSGITVTLRVRGPGDFADGSRTVTAVSDSSGMATFDSLVLNKAGAYTLRARVEQVRETSSSFTISAGDPTKLAFLGIHHRYFGCWGGWGNENSLRHVRVAVEDQFGNVVKTDTSAVTLDVGTGPANYTSNLPMTVNAVNGIATFTDVTLSPRGEYALAATDGSLTSASWSIRSWHHWRWD